MQLNKNEVLVLKSVKKDGSSFYERFFKYSLELGSKVNAPEGYNDFECDGGIRGLLWGIGYPDTLYLKNSKFLVFLVKNTKNNIVDLGERILFKAGILVFKSDCVHEATDFIAKFAPENTPIVYRKQITTDNGVTQVAGLCSTQRAGNNATQTAGGGSIQTAEKHANQSSTGRATQTACYKATQTAFGFSTQTAGKCAVQTAGDYSTQYASAGSKQVVGRFSTQSVGNDSIQTAGVGTVQIGRWFPDGPYGDGPYLLAVRVITEATANKPYKFKDGEWFPVSDS